MEVTKEHLEDRIEFFIKHRFYYLEYPDGVTEGFWKDGDANYVHMRDMSMDHLRACIRLIEKDMEVYDNNKAKDMAHLPVSEALFPLAEKKLQELKEEFKTKASET